MLYRALAAVVLAKTSTPATVNAELVSSVAEAEAKSKLVRPSNKPYHNPNSEVVVSAAALATETKTGASKERKSVFMCPGAKSGAHLFKSGSPVNSGACM